MFLLLEHQGRAFGATYATHALATLAAPLSWATATVIGKPLVQRESPLRITYLAVGLGSVLFIPAALLDRSVQAALPRFGIGDWIALAHLSINCTIIGFALFYAALRHLPASSVTAFVLLNPPLAILFGPLWGTDRPDLAVLGFGLFILAGVLLSVSAPGLPRLTPKMRRP